MDESEKKRLSITKTPEFYQPIVVRSPVPWSVSFGQAKEGFQFYEEQNERLSCIDLLKSSALVHFLAIRWYLFALNDVSA